jgi:hypothetical protein
MPEDIANWQKPLAVPILLVPGRTPAQLTGY